jgi:hypothetical protein
MKAKSCGRHEYMEDCPQCHEENKLGHYNSAGGFCCPHHGNTCGSHPEWPTEWEGDCICDNLVIPKVS